MASTHVVGIQEERSMCVSQRERESRVEKGKDVYCKLKRGKTEDATI